MKTYQPNLPSIPPSLLSISSHVSLPYLMHSLGLPLPLMYVSFSYGSTDEKIKENKRCATIDQHKNVTKLMALMHVSIQFQQSRLFKKCPHDLIFLPLFPSFQIPTSRCMIASHSYWLLLFWFLSICGGPHTNDPNGTKPTTTCE